MKVYRIAIEKYANSLFASGRPARWNDKNQFVLYTSSSRSLCALELLVRRASIKVRIPYKIMVIEVRIDENEIVDIQEKNLGKNWRTTGAYVALRQKGSEWYRSNNSLVMSVPSAVIPEERNFVINTQHTDYSTKTKLISTETFLWDERLIR
jgi:RES domain-containing protein